MQSQVLVAGRCKKKRLPSFLDSELLEAGALAPVQKIQLRQEFAVMTYSKSYNVDNNIK